MEVKYDASTGHILALVGTKPLAARNIDGSAIYAVAQWLDAHDDGYPYEITGDQGTYRLTATKCEPERVPYA